MIVRWSAPLSTADLNVRGYQPPAGPVLAAAPWDDVLVTEARSPDGARLRLGVEPFGDAPVAAAELTFTHLDPHAAYGLAGCDRPIELVAGPEGTASVTVTVAAPLQLVLEPAGGTS